MAIGPNAWRRGAKALREKAASTRARSRSPTRPTPAEIERARRILAAAAEAQDKGIGAFLVDGQIIDAPFLTGARTIVALADLHAARES